jgi:hypothetical protein
MAVCTVCGSALSELARFCTSCGNQTPIPATSAVAVGQTISMVRARPRYFVTYATGRTAGPFTDEEVRGMIARQEIKITDSIAAEGSTMWVPITQSPFAPFVVAQGSVDRLASSTCPRCGAGMAVTRKTPMLAFFFIAAGIFTAVALIGIPFLIIGWTMSRNSRFAYRCPRCNYSS